MHRRAVGAERFLGVHHKGQRFVVDAQLLGGVFGLRYVETPLWGGLMVTLVISYVGIVVSLPLGILLAMGRRSKMPM